MRSIIRLAPGASSRSRNRVRSAAAGFGDGADRSQHALAFVRVVDAVEAGQELLQFGDAFRRRRTVRVLDHRGQAVEEIVHANVQSVTQGNQETCVQPPDAPRQPAHGTARQVQVLLDLAGAQAEFGAPHADASSDLSVQDPVRIGNRSSGHVPMIANNDKKTS